MDIGGEGESTITITQFTPPSLILGTTRFLVAPSRRWTCISAEAGSSRLWSFSRTILARIGIKEVGLMLRSAGMRVI